GKSPDKVYASRPVGQGAVDEKALRLALTERTHRRVSGDNVISLDGQAWELDQGYLAGQVVTGVRCFVAPTEPRWVEQEGKRLVLRPLDPIKNARRKRLPRQGTAQSTKGRTVDFDPTKTLGDGEPTQAKPCTGGRS